MCTDLAQEWDWLNFVPDDSYLRESSASLYVFFGRYPPARSCCTGEFFNDREAFFPSALNYPVDVAWELPAYPAVHTLAALQTALQTSTWIQEGSVDSWYAAFGHTDAAESEADFMSALRAWLATPAGMAYSKDVVLSDDAGGPISMSRIGATYDPESVVTSEQMVAGMRGLRGEVAAVAAGAFPFTYQYMFWEQFGVVKEELYQNILYAVICVLVLCCTMIAHPGQGALVTGMVLMTLCAMGVSAAALGLGCDCCRL